MSKNKSKKSGNVEDYLAQVEWQNQQSQRQPYTPLPWYMEPKWKFKRVVSTSKNTLAKKTAIPVKVFLLLIALYTGYFLYKNNVCLLIIIVGMGLFIFFMMRDANNKKDNPQ